MVLLTIAALVGSIAFGSLGWWADNYSMVPAVTAIFGASLGVALVAIRLFMRQLNKDPPQPNSSGPGRHALQPHEHSPAR
jgi:hypothetical protein